MHERTDYSGRFEFLFGCPKSQFEPPKDIVQDRAGVMNLGIATPSGRIKARVGELLTEQLERNSMLQPDRDRLGKAADEPGHGRTFLRHRDKDLSRFSIRVQADCDVSLMPSDFKLVGHGHALIR